MRGRGTIEPCNIMPLNDFRDLGRKIPPSLNWYAIPTYKS